MSTTLTNRTRVAQYLLDRAKRTRFWNPTRVSRAALDEIEAAFRTALDHRIERHPSIGKTVLPDHTTPRKAPTP
jgi:hypothetical protein